MKTTEYHNEPKPASNFFIAKSGPSSTGLNMQTEYSTSLTVSPSDDSDYRYINDMGFPDNSLSDTLLNEKQGFLTPESLNLGSAQHSTTTNSDDLNQLQDKSLIQEPEMIGRELLFPTTDFLAPSLPIQDAFQSLNIPGSVDTIDVEPAHHTWENKTEFDKDMHGLQTLKIHPSPESTILPRSPSLEKDSAQNLPSDSIDQVQPISLRKHVTNPEAEYLNLLPVINIVNPSTYSNLLVSVLRECSHQIPLDDFYNLLFNINTPDSGFPLPVDGVKIDKSPSVHYKREGLMFCYYILETFRSPQTGPGPFAAGLINNPILPSINFQELRKTFLAIKIISDCVIEVGEALRNMSSIPRPELRNVYVNVTEKLQKNYPASKSSISVPENLLLCSSRIGKIAKQLFPDLNIRRFGRRGKSQYYYMGLIWNTLVVGDNMLSESKKNPQIQGPMNKHTKDVKKSTSLLKDTPGKQPENKASNSIGSKFSQTGSYSFVRKSSRYPDVDCSVRIWDYIPGQIPKHSEWAKKHLRDSVIVLKKYEVYVDLLVENFNAHVLSSEDFLYANFSRAMRTLISQKSSEEAYLHLYVVVLLLIFPVCLASREELSGGIKTEFRKNMSKFSSQVQMNTDEFTGCNSNHLRNFTNIVRKMVHMSRLISSHVKSALVARITKEIIHDIERPGIESQTATKAKVESIHRSVFMATKATALNSDKQGSIDDDTIIKIANAFIEFCACTSMAVLEIPNRMTPADLEQEGYDLPFQIFKISSKAFHTRCLNNTSVSKLPVSAINYVVSFITKDLQNASFDDFRRRDHDVSKDTFKAWWVYSSIVGEYMIILSELVSLLGLVESE